jgi:hypothetical protein
MTDATTDGLAQLAILAAEQFAAEVEVARIDQELADAKAKLRDIAWNQVPELMDKLGMREFTTNAGLKIKVSDDVRCGVIKSPPALKWLRDNGLGGLIKSRVTVPFSKGSEADADALVDKLQGEGMAATCTQEVHNQTMQSTIKGLLEEGKDVPLDLFGAHMQSRAKVEPAKKKR